VRQFQRQVLEIVLARAADDDGAALGLGHVVPGVWKRHAAWVTGGVSGIFVFYPCGTDARNVGIAQAASGGYQGCLRSSRGI
jgi:hypothetical protein